MSTYLGAEKNKEKEIDHSANYQATLDIIKELSLINKGYPEPLSRQEIRKKLREKGIDISETVIIKHLDNMVKDKAIAYIRKSKTSKGYKMFLKEAYEKIWDQHKNHYYIYTPESAKLYKILNKHINHITKTSKCEELIEHITAAFRASELFEKLQKKNLSTEKTRKIMHKFFEKGVKLKIPLKKKTKIDEVEYFLIGKRWIEVKELHHFLDVLYKRMNMVMIFNTVLIEKNRNDHFIPMMEKMAQLFIEIEERSQVKIVDELEHRNTYKSLTFPIQYRHP